MARRLFELVEPVAVVTYMANEPTEAVMALGLGNVWDAYFAGRAAPLGRDAPPEVVHALFYNFADGEVARHIPRVWELVTPEAANAARQQGSVAALRRILGDGADRPGVARAADLAIKAGSSARTEGRALYAAVRTLPVPTEPLAKLWHGCNLLREHRGDGHVAVLTSLPLGGRECNIVQEAGGNVPRPMIERARDYDDAEWTAIVRRLADRGLMTADGVLTDAGRALRQELEDRTDRVALAAYDALDDAALARLIELLTPIARAVVAGGDIPAATPMGPTFDA
jgi:hypothetical protein